MSNFERMFWLAWLLQPRTYLLPDDLAFGSAIAVDAQRLSAFHVGLSDGRQASSGKGYRNDVLLHSAYIGSRVEIWTAACR